MKPFHRTFYYFVPLFLISVISHTQDPLPVDWAVFETSSVDQRRTEAWDVVADESGHIYWMVDASHSSATGVDIHLFKLNKDGNMLWNDPYKIGGGGIQRGYRLTLNDSLLLIGGKECNGFGQQTCDFRIWAVTKSNQQAAFTFEDDLDQLYEECDGIIPLSDGYFTSGWTETDTSRLDVYLARLDAKGEAKWSRRWGSELGEHQDGHIARIGSTIYLCGAFGQPLPGYTNALYDGRSLLAAFDVESGELIDSVTWVSATPSDPYVENALGMASDGNHLYVTGVYSEGIGEWQLYIAKYTPALDRVWFRSWGYDGVESARSLIVHPDRGIYIAGQSQWGEGDDHDLALLHISREGEWLNAWRWGEDLDDAPYSIFLDDEKLYISGEANKSSGFFPTSDAFLLALSLDSLTTATDHPITSQLKNCTIAPNPVEEGAPIQWIPSNTGPVEIGTWINLLGQQSSVEQIGRNSLKAPTQRGTYWLKIYRKGIMVRCGPIIVE